MPLFDYLCLDCGKAFEVLLTGRDDPVVCGGCSSRNVKKLLSAHSSLSGPARNSLPGPGDHTCCGSAPTDAGCAGPGSCCRGNT